MQASEKQFAVFTSEGQALLRFDDLQRGAPVFQIVLPQTNTFVLSDDYLYSLERGWDTIAKYNLTNPEQPYLMQRIDTLTSAMGGGFLYDPDGPDGPLPQVLMVSDSPSGFWAFRW